MARIIIKESVADFAAAEENLEKIRSFLRDRLIETRLTRKEITGLLLAVEEAVSNIIRHGYLYAPGEVRLRVAHDRRRVTISISDSGRPFDWPQRGAVDYEKMVETSRKGGLGLVLIERVCDAADYRRTPAGENELVLSKNFPGAPKSTGKALSLRRRWAVAGIGVSTVAAAAFFMLARVQTGRAIRETHFNRWSNLARTAASAVSNLILNRASDAEFDELALKLARPDPAVRSLVIVDAQETILADSRRTESVRTHYQVPSGMKTDLDGVIQWSSGSSPSEYYVTAPVAINRRIVGRIHLLADGTALAAEEKAARVRLGLYGTGGMALLWALSVVVSGWLVRPLKRLSGSIRGAGTAPDRPSPERGGDEIQEIMEAFHNSANQIHQAERERYSRELARREWETAEQLQKALVMSTPPDLPGYEFGTLYRSARHVGGDWYDVFPLEEHTVVVTVADVSGKGLPGALVMASVRTAVRLLAEKHREPVALLRAVNSFVGGHLRSGMFVTMLAAMVDTRTHTVQFGSAGHTPLLFYRRTEKNVFDVNPPGWPLGMQLPEGQSFDRRLKPGNLPLEPGDVFILFTDGITEARNAQRELLGIGRLKDLLAGAGHLSAEKIAQEIYGGLTLFAGEQTLQDDIAAVVVKRSLRVVEAPEAPASGDDFLAMTPAAELWAGGQNDPLTNHLLRVVACHPEFDPPQICLELGRDEYDSLQVEEQAVRSRLLHLRLDDRKRRLGFAEWVRGREGGRT